MTPLRLYQALRRFLATYGWPRRRPARLGAVCSLRDPYYRRTLEEK